MLSYEATIVNELKKLGVTLAKNPDAKDNTGNLLGEYFLWKVVSKYAEAQEETAYKKLLETALFKVPTEPGRYEVAHSKSFTLSLTVTQPIKRFDPEVLAKKFKDSKYKVPEMYTIEKIDEAKVPGNSQVRKDIKEV